MPYKQPPPDILAAADAPQTPLAIIAPARDRLLFVEYEPQVPIEILARPFHKLAGIRIDPGLNGRRRMVRFTGLELMNLEDRKTFRIELPDHGTLGRMPFWAPDGSNIFFTLDTDEGIQLWAIDPQAAQAERVGDFTLNDTLVPISFNFHQQPFAWLPNGNLIARLVSRDGEVSEPLLVPDGPRVDETSGKHSQMATYQDLLSTELDEELFEHFATSQLAIVEVKSGRTSAVGKHGLYADIDVSPSGTHLLVTELHRPFSFRVPYSYFTRTVDVWDTSGEVVSRIADLGVSDEVPRQGVPTGPRGVEWQQNRPSSAIWAEALDGGDPKAEVEHRDRVMRLDASKEEAAHHVLDIKHRIMGWNWLETENEGLYTEWDRDRRWRTTHYIDLTAPEKSRPIIDISVNERYGDPGRPVSRVLPDGTRFVVQDGSRIFLMGQGQTPERARPFLRRLDLLTLEVDELFRCDEGSYESFWDFASPKRERILTRRESPSEPPNYFLIDLDSGEREQLTDLPDPHPDFTGVTKQIIRYTRADGVELSAMLYLPPGHEPADGPLPVLIWAYPLDFSDPSTAGQVTGSDRNFTRLSGSSPLWLLMRGWAVLMDAKMPIIGDPETMNDTYIEQIVDSAKAAIDALAELGVADPKRVAVGGHSYGAFMTANLLAHTDLFAAGVARSGAYNRSLTPFGFQTERRSYWEAPAIYQRVSPYNYANQIQSPLLLIHGEEDNNTGTFPIQSERLFQAIQGNGGTARLVILPLESHGYLARESNLHVLAETIEWLERFVK